jgi:hypothetical protein
VLVISIRVDGAAKAFSAEPRARVWITDTLDGAPPEPAERTDGEQNGAPRPGGLPPEPVERLAHRLIRTEHAIYQQNKVMLKADQ